MSEPKDLGKKIMRIAEGMGYMAPAQEPDDDEEPDAQEPDDEEPETEVVSVDVFRDGNGEFIHSVVQSTGYPTEAARYIAETLVPEFLEKFFEKNKGYGNMHGDLGLRAQYVDIHRKTGKLRRAWWDGKPIGPEQPREVVLDLLGHLFLALELMDGDQHLDATLERPDAGEPEDDRPIW